VDKLEEKEPYIIHQDTMLLKPAFSEYNEPLVDIYETSGQLTIAGRSTNVVKESCRYYGSSLSGRQEGTKAVPVIRGRSLWPSHRIGIYICFRSAHREISLVFGLTIAILRK